MRLAEHKREGDHEQLTTEIIVHVQDPAAPIFELRAAVRDRTTQAA
jgi:hypothetical protein